MSLYNEEVSEWHLLKSTAARSSLRAWPIRRTAAIYYKMPRLMVINIIKDETTLRLPVASKPYGTIYPGVTSELKQRVWQHKENLVEGFTKRHHIDRLVWYELHETIMLAVDREKNIKNWKRNWKIKLIENDNPNWQDLYASLF